MTSEPSERTFGTHQDMNGNDTYLESVSMTAFKLDNNNWRYVFIFIINEHYSLLF
jgi:hypothetical protein